MDPLDFDIDEEIRLGFLQERHQEVYPTIERLLAEFRISNLNTLIDFVESIVRRMKLPVVCVLEVAKIPRLAKLVLTLNVECPFDLPIFIPQFIQEYLEHRAPLNGLKAELIHRLSRMVRGKIGEAPRLLRAVGLACVSAKQEKAKAEVLREMSEYLLSIYQTVGLDDSNQRFFTLCIGSAKLNRKLLRSCLLLLNDASSGLSYDSRADLVDSLQRRIEETKDKRDFIDEYLELDEVFQRLRFSGDGRSFTDDKQNVHRIIIPPEVLKFIDDYEKKVEDRADSLDILYEHPLLKETLYRIDNDPLLYNGRTLPGLLRIVFIWAKDKGMISTLVQELQDMSGTCSTGHFLRMINVMNGVEFFLEVDDLRDPTRKTFFLRAGKLISSQENRDEILSDLSCKAKPFANQVAREMMGENTDWPGIMRARRAYLYGG